MIKLSKVLAWAGVLILCLSAASQTVALSVLHAGEVLVASDDGIHVFHGSPAIVIVSPKTSAALLVETRGTEPIDESTRDPFSGGQTYSRYPIRHFTLDGTLDCPRSAVQDVSSTAVVNLNSGDAVIKLQDGRVFRIASSGDRTLIVNARDPADTRNANPAPGPGDAC